MLKHHEATFGLAVIGVNLAISDVAGANTCADSDTECKLRQLCKLSSFTKTCQVTVVFDENWAVIEASELFFHVEVVPAEVFGVEEHTSGRNDARKSNDDGVDIAWSDD